jgi:hypothetical protein
VGCTGRFGTNSQAVMFQCSDAGLIGLAFELLNDDVKRVRLPY